MRVRVLFACGACVVVTLAAGVALAAVFEPGWPLPGPAPVTRGFGESYVGPDGTSVVHRGVDLGAQPGTSVTGVLEGSVTFAGRVPAGEGATTLAVTVESGEVRLTYLPLSEVSVVAGEAISPGTRLGTLAAEGDRSDPDPHLHVSARRGSLYVDPMPFLCPPAAPGGEGVSESIAAPAALPEAAPASPLAVPAAPVSVVQPQAVAAPGFAVSPSAVAAGSVNGAAASTVAVPSSAPVPDPAARPEAAGQTPSVAEVASGRSASIAAPAILDVLPGQTAAALTADKRAAVLDHAPLPLGATVGFAAVLGVVLLWPLWRAAPVLSVPVVPERDDVAAVVAR
jgi:hypothetical protein